MDRFSVVIPWRTDGGWRERVAAWVFDRYEAILPEAVLVCCDSDCADFTRGRAINNGMDTVETDVVMIADADTTFNRHTITEAVELVQATGCWAIAYDRYYNVDESYTRLLLNGSPREKIREGSVTWEHRLTEATDRVPVSGLVVLPTKAFEEVGGFCPGFQGWAYEDDAFTAAMNTLWGPYRRVEGPAFHMWHPRGLDFDQPYIHRNRSLWRRYQRAQGDPVAMRALVDE